MIKVWLEGLPDFDWISQKGTEIGRVTHAIILASGPQRTGVLEALNWLIENAQGELNGIHHRTGRVTAGRIKEEAKWQLEQLFLQAIRDELR